ncbi:MAG: PKD domain-containing protein, partial [Chitinivibrionales bacterium]|nr:PKD domain-containing protein [Chitinivibrionales bacterium]
MFSKKALLCLLTWVVAGGIPLFFSATHAYDRQEAILYNGTISASTGMLHSTTVAEASNGNIVVAWYGGPEEGEGCEIYSTFKTPGGSWAAVQKVTSLSAEGESWNPVLFQPSNGPLLLYYKTGGAPWYWTGYVRTSNDGGQTWSGRIQLPSGMLGPTKNPPIELPDGSLLLGSSRETGSNYGWSVVIEKAPAGNYTGGSWTKQTVISDNIQPTFIKLTPDCRNLRIFSRGGPQGGPREATSNNYGQSWGNVQSASVTSDPAICCVTCTNGWHVAAVDKGPNRQNLWLKISENGSSWVDGVEIINDGQAHDYPTVIQAPQEGNLHLTWTFGGRGPSGNALCGYAVVDPDVLTGGTSPSNQYPTASFIANPVSGDAPLVVDFDASGSSDPDGDALSYSWNFGDGSSGSGMMTSHTYSDAGVYTVTLSVNDGNGGSDQETASITVTSSPVNNPPNASFTASPTSGEEPLTVNVNAAGSSDPDGDALSYSWNFGDVSTGSG